MSDIYEIRTVTDHQTWDEFVHRAVGGTVFSTWGWLQCAQQATGNACRCLGVYRNGQLETISKRGLNPDRSLPDRLVAASEGETPGMKAADGTAVQQEQAA